MTQATLREALRFAGIGLHTGVQSVATVTPAQPDTGITFILDSPDRYGATVRVPALAENVVDTSRATVIGRHGASVSTTEHLLSALLGMGVTNAEIRVEGAEIPACDGSAQAFTEAIVSSGIVEQRRARAVLTIDEPFAMSVADRLIAVLPSHCFRVRFLADFPEPVGTQYFDGEIDGELYRTEIAGARTFGYLHEVEALRARGLARGGSLDNALVFAPDGPLQPLRWPNEVVRHKVLDLIGDFALLGAWPRCEIVAVKSGHELHALATRALRARIPAPSPTNF